MNFSISKVIQNGGWRRFGFFSFLYSSLEKKIYLPQWKYLLLIFISYKIICMVRLMFTKRSFCAFHCIVFATKPIFLYMKKEKKKRKKAYTIYIFTDHKMDLLFRCVRKKWILSIYSHRLVRPPVCLSAYNRTKTI